MKSLSLFDENAVWVRTTPIWSELLSETERKTERKTRFTLVCSTNSPIQPHTTTSQCARCLFHVPLGRVISKYDNIADKTNDLALKKDENIIQRYRDLYYEGT